MRKRSVRTIVTLLTFTRLAAADDDEALRLYAEGKAALQSGDLTTARDKLEAALRLGEGAGLYLRLAELEEKSGKPAKCLDYAKRAVAKAESVRPKLARVLQAATVQLDTCDELAPSVTIRLPSERPEGTVLLLDGRPLQVSGADLVVRVDPGTHTFGLDTPGHAPSSKTVSLGPRDRSEIRLNLSPSEHGGGIPWRPISTWSGVALLGAGALAGAAALSAKGDLDDQCVDKNCSPSARGDYDRANRWATMSTVGVVGGAALLSIGLFVLKDGPESSSKPDEASRIRLDLGASPYAGVVTTKWIF